MYVTRPPKWCFTWLFPRPSKHFPNQRQTAGMAEQEQDEAFQEAVLGQAAHLGMDPDKDAEFLWCVAHETISGKG